jgi:hypothetical protein
LHQDVPTLAAWAQAAHSNVGALRAMCRVAHTSAKPSLDFARMLRAVLQGPRCERWDLTNLLDVRHERTLARLLRRAGIEQAVRKRRAPSFPEFISTQDLVRVTANLRGRAT